MLERKKCIVQVTMIFPTPPEVFGGCNELIHQFSTSSNHSIITERSHITLDNVYFPSGLKLQHFPSDLQVFVINFKCCKKHLFPYCI